MQDKLDSIVILWRQPDTLTLWGIPYKMRPGQQPYDLWKARRDWKPLPAGWHGEAKRVDLSDWIYLGEPGWFCSLTDEAQRLIQAFLARHKDSVPGNPCEWSELR